MVVRFYDNDIKSNLKNKRRLKIQIQTLFFDEGKNLDSLIYIFCSDTKLLQLNKEYLQHDTYTDILTFDLSEGEKIIGEIYISIDRVRENSQVFEEKYERELHRVIFHGALHLCGYPDKSDNEKRRMRKKEQECLNLYFSV